MKRSILLLFCSIMFSSCAIQGLTNDYNGLSENQKETIVPLKSFDETTDLDKIYKINGYQLQEELKKYPKAMVYVFKNGCTSEYCKPLYFYENFANQNNYKLFLVMNGYANLEISTVEASKSPLFSIDNDYYKKKYRTTYTRFFQNDMLGRDLKSKEDEYLGQLFFFENGKLASIERDLPINPSSVYK